MDSDIEIDKIREQIRGVNHRLRDTQEDPCNADRAMRGALAVASFAAVTGQAEDVQIDPETVLGDLLANLMHWCDSQKTNCHLEDSIDFESALDRARNHYSEELAYEREQVS